MLSEMLFAALVVGDGDVIYIGLLPLLTVPQQAVDSFNYVVITL
jgi:hypothetical protein